MERRRQRHGATPTAKRSEIDVDPIARLAYLTGYQRMDGPYPWLVSSSSSSSRRRRAASAKGLSVHSSTYHHRDSSWNRRSRHSGRSLTRRESREGEMGTLSVSNGVGHVESTTCVYHVSMQTAASSSSSSHQDEAAVVCRVYVTILGSKRRLDECMVTRGTSATALDSSCLIEDATVFHPGTIKTFRIRGPDVGTILTIVVEHDLLDSFGSNWALKEVRVTRDNSGETYCFPIKSPSPRPASSSSSPPSPSPIPSPSVNGTIEEKSEGVDEKPVPPAIVYDVVVATGDVRGAGTTASVFITLTGASGTTPHVKLSNGFLDNFVRGSKSPFKIRCLSLGTLETIRIEHDNEGMAPSWFLDYVSIAEENSRGSLIYFPCGMWLDAAAGDGRTDRVLSAVKELPFQSKGYSGLRSYIVTTLTGHEKGCGTTSSVFLTLNGAQGSSCECRLDNERHNFRRGRLDCFSIKVAEDLGEIKSVTVRHDNSGAQSSWYLKKVTVFDSARLKKKFFECDRWLDVKHGLSATLVSESVGSAAQRLDLPIQKDMGTPERKSQQKRKKSKSQKLKSLDSQPTLPLSVPSPPPIQNENENKRETSPVDECEQERVIATTNGIEDEEKLSPNDGTWSFDEDKGEEATVQASSDLDNEISVETTDGGARSEAGKAEEAEEVPEDMFVPIKDEEEPSSLFNDRNAMETLEETYVPMGNDDETSIPARHEVENDPIDNRADAEKKDEESTDERQAEDKGDGGRSASTGLLSPFEEAQDVSEKSITTRDDDTEEKTVAFQETPLSDPERETLQANDVSPDPPSSSQRPSSPLPLLRGRHSSVTSSLSDSDANSGVSLSPLPSPTNDVKEVAPSSSTDDACSFSSEDSELRALQSPPTEGGDSLFSPPSEEAAARVTYEVVVFTSDLANAGTKANVTVELFGSDGKSSGPVALKSSGKQFKRDSVIFCYVESPDLGEFIERVRIWHDNGGFAPGWHLSKLEIAPVVRSSTSASAAPGEPSSPTWTHRNNENATVYACNRWLSRSEDDGEIIRELVPSLPPSSSRTALTLKRYRVLVYTGDARFAGTDANVFLTVFGSAGRDTGERQLRRSAAFKNKFERNDVDVFAVEAADLGPSLVRVRVRVDERLLGTGYYLEKIVVADADDGRSWVFPCQSWLAGGSVGEEATATRELLVEEKVPAQRRSHSPSLLTLDTTKGTSYRISVNTGDVFRAGTDAQVFVVLFGDDRSSDVLHLSQSLCSGGKFDRNKTDVFVFDVATPLGHLNAVKVWHDNRGFGAAWYLASIQVCDESTGRLYDFPCYSWLARDKGDGKTVRELKCQAVRADFEENEQDAINDSLPDRSKVQRLRERWFLSMFQLADKLKKKFVSEPDLIRVCKKLNVGLSSNAIKEKFKEIVKKAKSDTMDYGQFKTFFKDILHRPEVYLLFARYSSNREYMSVENLKKFLTSEQGALGVEDQYCEDVINDFGELEEEDRSDEGDTYHTRKLTLDGFSQYLLSVDNLVFNGAHSGVHQDMTQPLSHYFIASSHNTYLLEDQLRGQSSEEGYIRALRKGCRCVEIDCWDGEDGEPEVYHGFTLTSRVSLSKVLEAIERHAFDVSSYPVILSFENHCSIKGQQRMAELLQEIFGDKLYTEPVDRKKRHLPSPQDLCGRIIVKNKKLLSDENSKTFVMSDSDEEADSDFDDNVSMGETSLKSAIAASAGLSLPSPSQQEDGAKKRREKHPIALELSRLVNIVQAVKFKGLARGDFWKMSSLGESKLFKLIGSSPSQLVDYNRHQMLRVYPAGRRVDSSNYNPVDPWLCGVSMVALNYQFAGKMMDLNTGFFLRNGACGYVLKPSILRKDGVVFSPFSEAPIPETEPKLVTVKVISGQQFPKPSSSTSEKDGVDPSIVVEVCGAPQDRYEGRTKIISGNGFNPVWDEKFSFAVHWPEMALVRFLALSGKGTSNVIGQFALPFDSVLQGYRHVPLLSQAGHVQPYATVFVHISVSRGRLLKRSSSLKSTTSRRRSTLPSVNQSSRSGSSLLRQKRAKSREYVRMKKISVSQLDDVFESADYLLSQAHDLTADIVDHLGHLKKIGCSGEVPTDDDLVKVVQNLLESNSIHELCVEIEDDCPVLTSNKDSLPMEIASLTVVFQHVISSCRALVDEGKQIAEEIMRIHENGSKLTISVELKGAGLKEKTIGKAIESFAWNMQILRDSASVLKTERDNWQKRLDELKALYM